MSLKDLTADKHAAAEATPFMKRVIAGEVSLNEWADFTHQKSLFYNAIEGAAGAVGLTRDLPDIQRTHYLHMDYIQMARTTGEFQYRQVAIDYYQYLLSIAKDADKILAHLYVWHMGDLFGGQMIKKIVIAPHRALDFQDSKLLMTNFRAKLDDKLADEARVAFDWGIKLMETYE